MQLSELKDALDTEARREAKATDNENRRLKNVIAKKEERILSLEKSLRTMYVKCYNTTAANMPICQGCDQYGRCKQMRKDAAEATP